jgi:hypothetical protein
MFALRAIAFCNPRYVVLLCDDSPVVEPETNQDHRTHVAVADRLHYWFQEAYKFGRERYVYRPGCPGIPEPYIVDDVSVRMVLK